MEEHRLKPMPAGYDVQQFNHIYQTTEALRRKLASQIDYRKFGLGYEDIISAFATKLLFVFTKYYGEPEGIVKAKCIKAMQTYKLKIMRKSYVTKFSQTIISTELVPVEDKADDQDTRDHYYEKLMVFMKKYLSDNAYNLLDLQLNPPPYVLHRINPGKDSNLQKIPDDLLLEYFDLGNGEKAHKYLGELKKEIRSAINYAKIALRASS
jgi:hypothetical protein